MLRSFAVVCSKNGKSFISLYFLVRTVTSLYRATESSEAKSLKRKQNQPGTFVCGSDFIMTHLCKLSSARDVRYFNCKVHLD